ncbi:MAG: ISLre2 family transposase, partial [Hydrogenibacillus schlegelii]|nr:ISLre2 family transposase [Hydrogenibacillus schlegelii]
MARAEVSYRRAAEILASWVPGVSAMSVWKAVQELGEAERRRAAESRRRASRRGEVPAGTRKAEALGVEADGVWIRARKVRPEDSGFLEIKLGVAYEGRSENGRLKNRQAVAGVMEAEAFWEETVAQLGERWDLSVVRRIWLGGDGERWIKAGAAWLPGAVFRLDRYHLRRALLEALGSDREAYERVAEGIAQGDWNAVEKGLREAWVRATRRGKARVRRLEQYLRHNWEGMIALPEAWRLGAVEGEVFHIIARRMKRQGARWSRHGADALARLLTARANGRFGEAGRSEAKVHRSEAKEAKHRWRKPDIRQGLAHAAGEWLRGHLPALEGPFAGKPWVKFVLRELTRPVFP